MNARERFRLPWDELLEALHRSRWQVALVVAGGGSGAVGECFRRVGASRTFVDAAIPYSVPAMVDYVGGQPVGSSASMKTCLQLADVARGRCKRFAPADSHPELHAGIACVAALPSDRRRHQQDRAHVALSCAGRYQRWSMYFKEDAHSRESAEDGVDACLFAALAELAEVSLPFEWDAMVGVRVEVVAP